MRKMQQATKNKDKNFREEVFRQVKQIPKGKVATYGQVTLLLGRPGGAREVGWPFARAQGKMLLARAVGNALHENIDPRVPCHRVVDRNGRLAPNFAFSAIGGPANYCNTSRERKVLERLVIEYGGDGWLEQKRRLAAEGVKFVDEMHVNLSVSSWQK